MNLFTFREEHESAPEIKSCGRRGWRWALALGRGQRYVSIGLQRQVIFHDVGKVWHPAGEYFDLVCRWDRFTIASDHIYYDGPHCAFQFGFLQACWSYWNCEKCYPTTEEGT